MFATFAMFALLKIVAVNMFCFTHVLVEWGGLAWGRGGGGA